MNENKKNSRIQECRLMARKVFAVTETTLNCVATRYGTGRHAWDIKRSNAIPGGRVRIQFFIKAMFLLM